MSPRPNREASALAAVDAIIADFGNHRTGAYFAGFAPEATFVFHTTPERVESRAGYEALWAEWESTAGFRVRGCLSTNRRIQVFGEVAVFSHDVETILETDGTAETVFERESIVLQRRDGVWLGVHEHLSAVTPDASATVSEVS